MSRTQRNILPLFVLALVTLRSSAVTKDFVDGFGPMREFFSYPGLNVSHMEEDLFIEGNFLISTLAGLATISTDRVKSLSVIVGSVSDKPIRGYRDGVGEIAAFDSISSFVQVNKTHVLLADQGNKCLRFVNRENNETSKLTGVCASNTEATNKIKNGPYSIATVPEPGMLVQGRGEEEIFLTERFQNAVRRLDKDGVSTIVESLRKFKLPYAMAWDYDETLYVSTMDNIFAVNMTTYNITPVFMSLRGTIDGSFEEARVSGSEMLIFLEPGLLLSLEIQPLAAIRLIDFRDRTVRTLPKLKEKYLNIFSALHVPSYKRLYFGGTNGLYYMEYDLSGAVIFTHSLVITSIVIGAWIAI